MGPELPGGSAVSEADRVGTGGDDGSCADSPRPGVAGIPVANGEPEENRGAPSGVPRPDALLGLACLLGPGVSAVLVLDDEELDVLAALQAALLEDVKVA